MARADSAPLDTRTPFPKMELRLASGGSLTLPDPGGRGFTVFLVYRGHWWPDCRQQLADFQKSLARFAARGGTGGAGCGGGFGDAPGTIESPGLGWPQGA